MCPCCPISHIRREPEAETKDAAEASEAAAAEQQKQHKNWATKAPGGVPRPNGKTGGRILKFGLRRRGSDALGPLVPEQPAPPLNQNAAGAPRPNEGTGTGGKRRCYSGMRWHPKARSLASRIGGGVGFVDSEREKNKARAVLEISEPGVLPTPGLHPFDTTKTRCSHTTNPSEKRLTWTSRSTSSSPSLTHDSSA